MRTPSCVSVQLTVLCQFFSLGGFAYFPIPPSRERSATLSSPKLSRREGSQCLSFHYLASSMSSYSYSFFELEVSVTGEDGFFLFLMLDSVSSFVRAIRGEGTRLWSVCKQTKKQLDHTCLSKTRSEGDSTCAGAPWLDLLQAILFACTLCLLLLWQKAYCWSEGALKTGCTQAHLGRRGTF